MSFRPDVIGVGADGFLEGIRIVAMQGVVDPASTPARRAPVLMDEKRRIVELLSAAAPHEGAPRSVVVERSQPLAKNRALLGEVTRIAPLPARLGDIMIVLGPRDREAIGDLLAQSRRLVELDGLVIVAASIDEALVLCSCIATKAIDSIHSAAAMNASSALENAAWWLSRATVEPSQLAIAVVALRRARSPHAAILEREAFRGQPSTSVERWLAEAERNLLPRPELAARSHVRRGQFSPSQSDHSLDAA
jgi:hypothetical protein